MPSYKEVVKAGNLVIDMFSNPGSNLRFEALYEGNLNQVTIKAEWWHDLHQAIDKLSEALGRKVKMPMP